MIFFDEIDFESIGVERWTARTIRTGFRWIALGKVNWLFDAVSKYVVVVLIVDDSFDDVASGGLDVDVVVVVDDDDDKSFHEHLQTKDKNFFLGFLFSFVSAFLFRSRYSFVFDSMSKSTAASDPLFHDVAPEYERYTKFFFIISGLVCFTSMICAVIQAQQETRFYVIILSLIVSMAFTVCIYIFFKRRILLAEKLWFVNLTIFILFLQALIYLIFVFIKPYPIPPITTPRTTMRTTTHNSTLPPNSTNMSNITTTTRTSTTTTKRVILTKLYDLDET